MMAGRTSTLAGHRGRSILVAVALLLLLLMGLALAPTPAKADPVSNQGCTVQVVFEQAPAPHPRVFFDCDFNVTHIEGETNKGAVWPGFQGNPPTEGFLCPDPFSGPMEPPVPGEGFQCGGGPNDRAFSDVNSDACGELEPGLFTVTNINFDNRTNPLDETTATRTARVENIVIQGCPGGEEPGPGPAGDGGGGGGDGQRAASEEDCPPGTERRSVDGGGGDGESSTQHSNEDRSTGQPEGEHFESTSGGSGGGDGFECVDTGKGKPRGGVEAGFGGGLVEAGFGGGPQRGTLEEVNKAPTLLLLGGSTLLAAGLFGGGWLVFRRRT